MLLWRRVTEQAKPLHPDRDNVFFDSSGLPSAPEIDPPKEKFPLKPKTTETCHFVQTQKPHSRANARNAVSMDHKAFTKMERGKLRIEGRIDLHGMTLDEAHSALISFVLAAHSRGKRLLLVITGKGEAEGRAADWHQGRGLLKRQVPIWLTSLTLAPLILQLSEAHRSHGGSGAYYVYLRRSR